MHLIAVKKELAEDPDLLLAVYDGFCEAKEKIQNQMNFGLIFNNMPTMVPWFSNLVEENKKLMGEDWWPYGMTANRKAVDTFLRYHYEQGLSKKLLTSDDIFVKSLMDT